MLTVIQADTAYLCTISGGSVLRIYGQHFQYCGRYSSRITMPVLAAQNKVHTLNRPTVV